MVLDRLTMTAKLNPSRLFEDVHEVKDAVKAAQYAADERVPRVELQCNVGGVRVSGIIATGGEIEVVGARTEQDARTALDILTKHISSQLGQTLSTSDLSHANAVARADCGFRVDLERLACCAELAPDQLQLYEPEVFPGLLLRAGSGTGTGTGAGAGLAGVGEGSGAGAGSTAAVFATGRVEMWGSGQEDGAALRSAFQRLYPLLEKFKE